MTRFPEIGSEMDELGLQATRIDMPDVVKGQIISEDKSEVLIDKETGLVTFRQPILEKP